MIRLIILLFFVLLIFHRLILFFPLYSKLYSSVYLPNRLYHQQAHLDAVNGVIGPGDGQSADAVVTVAQNLYSHALVFLQTKRGEEKNKRPIRN